MNKKNHVFKFLSCAALLFIFLRAAVYDDLIVRKYEVSTELVTEPHTFVLLSDLHSTFYGDKQVKLISTIAKYSPEAILMTGDIADDKREFEGTSILLEKLSYCYPCYYVTGNHERWVDYTDDIKSLFRSYGIHVLDDTVSPVPVSGGEISLFGVDDPLFYADHAEYLKCLENLSSSAETFDLLLAHRPEYYDAYTAAEFDLILCGHAHGGQIRIPFLMNGLYAPGQGYFPKYAGGIYEAAENKIMIVSRGLMKDDLPRIFNPPEVCVIQILPEHQKELMS